MRGGVVVSAMREFTVDAFCSCPWLVGKRLIRRIHDHSSRGGGQKILGVLFQPVVGATRVGLVITGEIRFAIRGSSNRRACGWTRRSGLTASLGRHLGYRRQQCYG